MAQNMPGLAHLGSSCNSESVSVYLSCVISASLVSRYGSPASVASLCKLVVQGPTVVSLTFLFVRD